MTNDNRLSWELEVLKKDFEILKKELYEEKNKSEELKERLNREVQRSDSLENKLNNLSSGIGRGLWIIGGGFITSIVAWIAGGGLGK